MCGRVKIEQLIHSEQKFKTESNQRKNNPSFQGFMGQTSRKNVKKGAKS